jgi:hypothetical protein
MQMAGPSNGEWSQIEDFFIQVLPAVLPPAPIPTITAPSLSTGQFSVTVATVSGYTYYLDYKQMLDAPAWSNAAQVAGDGSGKVLTDSSAGDSQRYYRVRVE